LVALSLTLNAGHRLGHSIYPPQWWVNRMKSDWSGAGRAACDWRVSRQAAACRAPYSVRCNGTECPRQC